MKVKCNRDCFNCAYEDCQCDDITKTEREMQNYRDACITITGKIPKAHGSGKNVPRKGGRYTSDFLSRKWR